jgi:hypothetical protein
MERLQVVVVVALQVRPQLQREEGVGLLRGVAAVEEEVARQVALAARLFLEAPERLEEHLLLQGELVLNQVVAVVAQEFRP